MENIIFVDLVPPSIGSANYVSNCHCRLFPLPTIAVRLYQGGRGLPNPWELPLPRRQSHKVLLPAVVNQWSGGKTEPITNSKYLVLPSPR